MNDYEWIDRETALVHGFTLEPECPQPLGTDTSEPAPPEAQPTPSGQEKQPAKPKEP
jgi:hypothetical protein